MTIVLKFSSQRAALSVEAKSYAAACRKACALLRATFGRMLFRQEFTGDRAGERVWIVADGRPSFSSHLERQ